MYAAIRGYEQREIAKERRLSMISNPLVQDYGERVKKSRKRKFTAETRVKRDKKKADKEAAKKEAAAAEYE